MAKKQNPVKVEQIPQDEVLTIEQENEEFEQVAEEMQIDLEVEQDKIVQPALKVGQRARQLILEGKLDNKGILEQIKKEYPNAKTSIACIAWYKSDLKKTKVDPDQGYKDWLKLMEKDLRAEYEATLVTE